MSELEPGRPEAPLAGSVPAPAGSARSGPTPSGPAPAGSALSNPVPFGPASSGSASSGRAARPDGLDLRLAPAALAAWAGQWLTVWHQTGLAVTSLTAALAALLAWRRRSTVLALVATVLAATAVIGGLRVWRLTQGPAPDLARQEAVAAVELTVGHSALVGQGETVLVHATLERVSGRGQAFTTHLAVLLVVNGSAGADWLGLDPGRRMAVEGRLAPAERADGVAALLKPLGPPRLVAEAPAWRRAVEQVRRSLRQAMARASPEQAALVPALVVGDTEAMPASLRQDFQTTGLTHLTAVSGANLTILLAFLSVLARLIGLRGRWLDLVALVGVIGFVALCHSEPSVLRAAAMGLVGLVALRHSPASGRGLRHLCLAVVGLTWIDPWLSHSIGFVLSVLACLGLLVWGRPWSLALGRWLPGWLAEAVAVPLAAQLATQPVVAWLSGSVSLVGVLANALAGPPVGPATVLGLVTALVGSFSPALGGLVGRLTGWLVEPILQVAHRCARLPGAAQPWPAQPVALVCLTAGCLTLAWLMPRLLGRSWLVLILAVGLVVGLGRAPMQPGWPPSDWSVVACDVGQGDALAVKVGPGQALLIDVGPPQAGLGRCLDGLGVRQVPVVVLSHFHADHVGGLAELLAGWPVGLIVANQSDGAASSAQALAAQRAVDWRQVGAGDSLSLGDVQLTVLSEAPATTVFDQAEESSAANDASLVCRVVVDGISLLATGDLELAGQQALVAAGVDLAVDVLKLPHHGSARQEAAFLARTGARIALISVGEGNDYGHPADSALRRLDELGALVARTDQHGSIAIGRRAGELVIVSQR
ncbi:MAG: ComEC/Rec2 family competence protein [Propionibacteriaceae bacterium]|nr:ComEC/Rec2 family competence protein [Propionibacteriaceae bacterium]